MLRECTFLVDHSLAMDRAVLVHEMVVDSSSSERGKSCGNSDEVVLSGSALLNHLLAKYTIRMSLRPVFLYLVLQASPRNLSFLCQLLLRPDVVHS